MRPSCSTGARPTPHGSPSSMIATRYRKPWRSAQSISAAHTWFGRSIIIWRRRYGKILCLGAGLVVLGFGPSAAMPILRLNRCMRLRLMRQPSPLSIAVIRREPRNYQGVNSSSIRRISSRSLSLAGRGGRHRLDRVTLSSWHRRRIDRRSRSR